tara:strand:+ start:691 stop:2211 length:1521 start_codon:yes stop_codon:yes gene_type:complete
LINILLDKIEKITYKVLSAYALIILYLYSPSLKIWAMGDDFSTVLITLINPEERWEIFSTGGFAFRPLERLLNAIDSTINGPFSTVITHCFSLVSFSLSALLVFLITNYLFKSKLILSFTCTILFIVSPNNVASITQIDTVSQQLATLFILFSIWWILTRTEINQFLYHSVFGISLFLALMSKENPIGIIFVIPVATFLMRIGINDFKYSSTYKHLLVCYGTVISVFMFYMFLRSHFGFELKGSNQYQVGISLIDLMKNSLHIIGSVVYPGSSLEIYPNFQFHKIIISLSLFLSFLIITIPYIKHKYLANGMNTLSFKNIFKQKGIPIYLSLIMLIFSGLVPVILIGKMSELYTYLLTPFYSMFLGILFYESIYYSKEKSTSSHYYFNLVAFFCLILWLGYGTKNKVNHLIYTDKKTKQYYSVISDIAKKHQESRIRIVLSNEITTGTDYNYNVFLFSDTSILNSFSPLIMKLYNKNIEYIKTELVSNSYDYVLQKELGILKALKE